MSPPSPSTPPNPVRRDFDAVAAGWDEDPRRVKLSTQIVAAIRREVPLDARHSLLDYGAGTGLVTLALAPHVGRALAVDGSAGMLAALERKLGAGVAANVRVQQIDLERGGVLDGPFDVIVSSMTLHHVQQPLVVLRPLVAALAPGGVLALADLDEEGGRFHPDPTGVFHEGFARDHIADLFTQAGLREVRVVDAATVERRHPERGEERFGIFLAIGRR